MVSTFMHQVARDAHAHEIIQRFEVDNAGRDRTPDREMWNSNLQHLNVLLEGVPVDPCSHHDHLSAGHRVLSMSQPQAA